jgi:hypothetical protein
MIPDDMLPDNHDDIYEEEGIGEFIDSNEIDGSEAGFMNGYLTS